MKEDNTPEVELEWTDLGTDPDPDYVDLQADDAPTFAVPQRDEKTVPYPMSRRVLEGSEGALVVEFDLPGVRSGDITVTIENDKVEVRACRPGKDEPESSVFSVPLYDFERASAWTDAGVLRIRIPRAEFPRRDVFVRAF